MLTRSRCRRFRALALSTCAAIGLAAGCKTSHPSTSSADFPLSAAVPGFPISGIAPLSRSRADRSFVVVRDVKAGKNDARCAVVTMGPGRPDDRAPLDPLDVLGPSSGDANDLEAIAPVPNSPGSFFLLESGGSAKSRRLFRIRVTSETGAWKAVPEGDPVDLRPATDALENVEAMLAITHEGGGYRIVLADREQGKKPTGQAGATVNLFSCIVGRPAPIVMDSWASIDLPDEFGKDWRICTDLTADYTGDIFLATAYDPGDDGPFESRVYRIGRLSGEKILVGRHPPTRVFQHKVEGLCETIVGSRGAFFMACDDENQGGWIMSGPTPKPE